MSTPLRGLAAIACLLVASIGHAQPLPTDSPTSEASLAAFGGVITLKVPQYESARQQMIVETQKRQGTVTASHTDVAADGRKHGWMRVSLPADRFPEFLAQVRQSGILYADRITSHDGRPEYEGLGHRATHLREHQARLDALLKSSRRLRGSDILYVQERLFRSGVDESAVEQQRLELSRSAEKATLQIAFFEPISVRKSDRARLDLSDHFNLAQNNARSLLVGVLSRATTAAAVAFVFAPLWAPCLITALLMLRWFWKVSAPGRRLALVFMSGTVIFMQRTLYPALRERASRVAAPPAPPATLASLTEEKT